MKVWNFSKIHITYLWYRLKDPLRKNALFLMANTATISILGFVFWMIATRVYSPSEVGLASATISAIGLIAMFGMLGFDIALIRFLPNAKEPDKIINSSLTITFIFSLILGLAYVIGLHFGFWSRALGYLLEDFRLTILFLIFIVIATINPLINSTFVAKRKAKFVLINSIIFSVSKILLIVLLASLTVFGILLSWGIAFILAVSISTFLILPYLFLRYRTRLSVNKKYISNMFRYSIGNYIVGIFGSAPGLLLPLIIVEILSSEETAYFTVSWMIAYFLFAIPISVSRSLLAEGSTFEKNFKEDLKKAIKFLALLLSIGVVVVAIGSKEILSLGFGASYAENAANVLSLFALSAFPVSINTLYTAIKRVEKITKEITVIYGFIAIGTIGLSIVLLKEVGLIGVPIAWIITQSITTPVTLKGIYNVLKHGLKNTNNIK